LWRASSAPLRRRTTGAPAGPDGSGDEQLVEALRRRDPAALAALYSRYAGDIYNLACRMVRSGEDAEDITQDVLLRAYERLPRGRDVNLQPWLYRITVNRCYDVMRASARCPNGGGVPDETATRVDTFAQAELSRLMESALDALTPRQRAAMLLKDVHGLSLDEVAATMSITSGSVEVLLSRARRAFRERFEELCQGDGRPVPSWSVVGMVPAALVHHPLPPALQAPPLAAPAGAGPSASAAPPAPTPCAPPPPVVPPALAGGAGATLVGSVTAKVATVLVAGGLAVTTAVTSLPRASTASTHRLPGRVAAAAAYTVDRAGAQPASAGAPASAASPGASAQPTPAPEPTSSVPPSGIAPTDAPSAQPQPTPSPTASAAPGNGSRGDTARRVKQRLRAGLPVSPRLLARLALHGKLPERLLVRCALAGKLPRWAVVKLALADKLPRWVVARLALAGRLPRWVVGRLALADRLAPRAVDKLALSGKLPRAAVIRLALRGALTPSVTLRLARRGDLPPPVIGRLALEGRLTAAALLGRLALRGDLPQGMVRRLAVRGLLPKWVVRRLVRQGLLPRSVLGSSPKPSPTSSPSPTPEPSPAASSSS
jgi:RNA polymerase sigma-70 factor (ECF subfamily)